MDINILRRSIENVDTGIFGSVTMKLVQKINGGYEIYQPNLETDMDNDLKELYHEVMNNRFFDRDQSEYNPNTVVDNTIECAPVTLAHADEVLELIDVNEDGHGDLTNLNLENINFYCVKFVVDNEEIHIFRRFTKMKKIRNGLFGRIEDNTFHRIENDKFYGIDRDIDIIIFRGEMLIVNRFALQTIFSLEDYFTQQTTEALDYLQENDVIENFQDFREDCLNDKLASKRMTKILQTEGRLRGFVENQHLLPTIIEQAALNIELNEDDKIVYTSDREVRSQVLYVLADAYYRSLMLERIGEDISQ